MMMMIITINEYDHDHPGVEDDHHHCGQGGEAAVTYQGDHHDQ